MAQSCRAVSSQPRWASPVTWKIEALPRKTPETANDHAFSQLFLRLAATRCSAPVVGRCKIL